LPRSNRTEDHDTRSSEDHSGSHSCESCEKDFKYKCNNNEWVNYMLDEQPAEDGIYVGDSKPGIPIFVGGFFPGKYPVGISITNPKGGTLIKSKVFLNNSATLHYLKRDCHHKYEWVNSSNGEIEPYGMQAFYEDATGSSVYIARKVFTDYTAFTEVFASLGFAAYLDKDGNTINTKEYQVLTCKSKHFEAPPETTTTTASPEVASLNNNGCSKILFHR
jgi:hypothetical protein